MWMEKGREQWDRDPSERKKEKKEKKKYAALKKYDHIYALT